MLAVIATPAFAQAMDSMPGMKMGPGIKMEPATTMPPGMDMGNQPAPAATPSALGTDQSPGTAAPPPVAPGSAAGRYFGPTAMAAATAAMMAPPPGYSQVRIDLAEFQVHDGHDGYRWEGEAWTGDLNRFVLRSEGEGSNRHLDSAEVQALYSRALDPWWNLQIGVREDIRPTPARTYATIGIEGLAPYKFDVLVAAFVSDRGQLTGRIETSVDERLTRHLILQPRVELNFSAQDMPAQRLGAGLDTAELGLRLRYEITRKIAPYVGFSFTQAAGKTADYLRAGGDSAQQRSLVIGIRSWF